MRLRVFAVLLCVAVVGMTAGAQSAATDVRVTQFIFRKPTPSGGTVTAASCSAADITTAMNTIGSNTGRTLAIPVCAGQSLTSPISWIVPANTTIRGAGSLSTLGGGDATNLVDDYASGSSLITLTAPATGTFRLAGITIKGGTGSLKPGGVMRLESATACSTGLPSTTIRMDHMHINTQTYSGGARNVPTVWAGDNIKGVYDHNIFRASSLDALYFFNCQGSDSQANESWSAPTNFGGADALYLEDNLFIGTGGSRIGDSYNGARVVWRFNTLQGTAGLENHATGHAGDGRGHRASESYGNSFDLISGQTVPSFDMADVSSGTQLLWGNSAVLESINHVIHLNATRKGNDTYVQNVPPSSFGYCAGTPTTGTVNVAPDGVTVTKASGTNFNTGWPSDTMITITGAACQVGINAVIGPSTSCRVSSVASTTSLTLTATTGGALTGATYTVGSAWDGNTDVRGYPCLDQPGRGPGQLLTGSFPSKINNVTGTAAWPNQSLEPIYFWMINATPSAAYSGQFYANDSGSRIQADRDYYAQASGIQTTSSSPFNGTTGTGWGTLALRPSTCTTGVGYFATDQGSWNASSTNSQGVQFSGADGLLYTCTSTNTWTLYYTPYQYPHVLVQ